MKLRPLSVFLFIVPLFLLSPVSIYSANIAGPSDEPSQLTSLEELTAELQNQGRIVEVKGAVRNISNAYLKGFITIYLLDKNGEVINAKNQQLGNGLEFGQGMVVDFETSVIIGKKKEIATISIDFTRE